MLLDNQFLHVRPGLPPDHCIPECRHEHFTVTFVLEDRIVVSGFGVRATKMVTSTYSLEGSAMLHPLIFDMVITLLQFRVSEAIATARLRDHLAAR